MNSDLPSTEPESAGAVRTVRNCSRRPAFFMDISHLQRALPMFPASTKRFTLAALTAALFAGGCGSAVSLTSSAPAEPVVVDAQLNEWGGKLSTLSGSDALLVGMQNDDERLYLALSTRNGASIGSIMRAGLIIWFDPDGGKEQAFGIRFPLGLSMDDTGNRRLSEGAAGDRIRIQRSTQEMEIIGADGQTMRRNKDAIPGIVAAIEADQGVLTYEIAVPLVPASGVLYAIGAEPGTQIGVGVATPEEFVVNVAQQPGFGGLPGGRMASAEERGYRGPPPGGLGISTFKEWMLVTLAE